MLFNSVHFLLFFPVVCALSFCWRSVRSRNLFLLLASYYFYMNWQPVYALLLLTSTLITYFAALLMAKSELHSVRRRLWLVLSIVLNLSILFLFKYYQFVADNLTALFCHWGIHLGLPEFPWLLPVGISFYTFQALGYAIDVYRGNISAERNPITYALFISFFPQLVAGPIERSSHLLPQFKKLHPFSYDDAMTGLKWMLWGYFLKLALADRCGIYVDAIYNNLEYHNGTSYLIASLLFPFQIYGDFAGYSLTAIGAARVMGFRLMENFRRPYFAATVSEFWRRWHISLSTWFKDYVYIPLGGNRVSRPRGYLNVMMTMTISGIWHGANWSFIVWGILHGLMQCIEKMLGLGRASFRGIRRWVHVIITFFWVSAAWVFFRADSLSDAVTVFTGICLRPGVPKLNLADWMAAGVALLILFAKEWRDERGKSVQRTRLSEHVRLALMCAYLLLLGVLNGDQFIYFQF